MNGITDFLGNRLRLLLGDVHFMSDFHKVIGSSDQLIACGAYITTQLEEMEAMKKEHQERIQTIFSNVLASSLQEEAIAKYGNTDGGSIRQVLLEWFNRPEDLIFQNRLRDTAKQALLGLDLTEEQCTSVLAHFYDKLPNMLTDYIEELIEPIHMLPRSEAQPIVMALVDMMKEMENDNCR